jgi:peptidoglycan/LPS O-acetylase OafA/YrhL
VINFFRIPFNKNRIYGLDILRALAILFVIIAHGSVYLPENLQGISYFISFDGVTIFFVLSGFLIGGILIKLLEKNKPSIRTLFNFWIRRWFRTLPNYYLVLLLLLMVLPYIFYGGMSNPFRKMEYLLFLQNLNYPHPHLFDEAWSLCVEEWFYLLVPIIIFILVGFIKLSVKNAVFISAITVLITSMTFRYIKYLDIPINSFIDLDMNIRKQVFTRLDSNMYGLVGALISFYYKEVWKKYKNILFLIGIIILIVHRYIPFGGAYGIYMCVFSFSLMSLGVLLLLPLLSEYKKGSGIIYNIFTFISIISYSMYLLNYSIFNEYGILGFNHCSLTGDTLIFAKYFWYWFFIIMGSFLLYKFYEKPMMKIREKFSSEPRLDPIKR